MGVEFTSLASAAAFCLCADLIPLYLYPRAVLENPPSCRSGYLSVEGEARNRALGCILIAKAGQMLTLPQSTISSAQVLLHRFYFRVSMHSYKLLRVCMTAVFVAAKVEETPVRLRDTLACFDRLLKRRAGLEPTPLAEQRYEIWAAGVLSCEGVLLRELGFELYIDLPHAFILHFLNYLHPRIEEAPPAEQRTWGELRQRSWNALNDALLSPRLMFAFHPHVLACGAIVVAASLLSLPLPHEWWMLFDVHTHTLDSCALQFAHTYALLSRAAADSTSAASGGQLDYTPAHADDNDTNNELAKFRPANRKARLEQARKDREERQAAAAAAVAASAAAAEEQKAATAASNSTASPMETS